MLLWFVTKMNGRFAKNKEDLTKIKISVEGEDFFFFFAKFKVEDVIWSEWRLSLEKSV